MKCLWTMQATILVALLYSHDLNAACPDRYEDVYGYCLHFGQTYLTFAAAWQRCRNVNGVPISIEDSDKMGALITYLLKKPRGNYWIGASNLAEQGVWRWLQNGKIMNFTNWCQGEPNSIGDGEHCIETISGYNYCWNDWSCIEKLMYICDYDESTSQTTSNIKTNVGTLSNQTTPDDCPPPYVDVQGSCYYASLQAFNFQDASKECKQRNGVLASIDSEAEQRAVAKYINDHVTASDYMWIGASDAAREGEWVWSGNEQPVNYTNWCENQPDDWLDDQNCAAFKADQKRCWDDAFCVQTFGFVCKLISKNSS